MINRSRRFSHQKTRVEFYDYINKFANKLSLKIDEGIMLTLTQICEGILGNIESDIENYVEAFDKMKNDLRWMDNIKIDDAPYIEAALFNVTYEAFRKCSNNADAEYKRLLAIFMNTANVKYSCFNFDGIDNWEEREYEHTPSFVGRDDVAKEMLSADPDDYRWHWNGSNSFYEYFWEADYIHSLDQEDLLDSKKCQQYSKKLIAIAKKYGLNLKPIF